MLDVGDNISPGPYPVASHADEGLEAVPFPPRQTTICPLGPSSVAPITSTIPRFRHEFEARITRGMASRWQLQSPQGRPAHETDAVEIPVVEIQVDGETVAAHPGNC
ncbi:MAG: hypothetical protein CM1200mP26_16160 [Acidimicrobiales bacterium]|nr:MAG: hypothetical protein CM1200mP26_16160 [Acidimicrobiales bacterium]